MKNSLKWLAVVALSVITGAVGARLAQAQPTSSVTIEPTTLTARYEQIAVPDQCQPVSAAPGRSITTKPPAVAGIIITCKDGRVFIGKFNTFVQGPN